MPVYEFYCPKCCHEFEVIRPVSKASEPATCTACGTKAERLVSVAGIRLATWIKPPEKPFRKRSTKKSK